MEEDSYYYHLLVCRKSKLVCRKAGEGRGRHLRGLINNIYNYFGVLQPIRFVIFDNESVNRGLPVFEAQLSCM